MRLLVPIMAVLLVLGCASRQDAAHNLSEAEVLELTGRIDTAWPRVRSELGNYPNVPEGIGDAHAEIAARTESLDAAIEAEAWRDAADMWYDESMGPDCFMAINWTYRGSSSGAYREWARWHVREFEIALAILTGDVVVQQQLEDSHGPAPALPSYP